LELLPPTNRRRTEGEIEMTTAELATRILSQLGFSTAVTMEPSADYRRDKIVEMIDEQKAQWREEVLLDVETEIANKLLTDGYKAVQVIRRMAESTKAETDSLQNPAGKY